MTLHVGRYRARSSGYDGPPQVKPAPPPAPPMRDDFGTKIHEGWKVSGRVTSVTINGQTYVQRDPLTFGAEDEIGVRLGDDGFEAFIAQRKQASRWRRILRWLSR